MRWVIPVAALLSFVGCAPQQEDILIRAELLPDVSARRAPYEWPFEDNLELFIRQPLDHENPTAGHFSQKVLLGHKGFDRPVILITEGYTLGDNVIGELAEMIDANQMRVEHRYVGESVPSELDWEFLTVAQASGDYHRIRQIFEEVYSGPWISAGWSKGGQTALFYRHHYPGDTVATVAYDAPAPMALEDPRIDAHFVKVGTVECRQRLERFQRIALERRDTLLPLFSWYAKGKGWAFDFGDDVAFDYTVLEFPFSFWQYSAADCEGLPGPGAGDEVLLEKLVEVVDAGWFADANLESPSFHQFCTELGFYGYVEDPFAGLLVNEDYPMCVWAPDWSPEDFDPEPMRRLDHWLRNEADRVMSIYGGIDPWSAPAIPVGGNDQVQFWKRDGNHFTLIRSLSELDQETAREFLAGWVGMPLEEVGR